MKYSNSVHEQVSALADGQLQDDELVQMIGKVCIDDELRATWRTYHLIGDVLRSGVHTTCSDNTVFLSRLQGRLAGESIRPVALPEDESIPRSRVEASNEPVFRWKLVAGVASLAAAAAIGWNWVGGAGGQFAGPQLAQQEVSNSLLAASNAPQQAASALAPMRVMVGKGAPQVVLRDPRLDQLLEAHQQAGGASQMPSGFLRNATFDGPSR